MDLADPAEQERLLQATFGFEPIHTLLTSHLDDYLRLFPGADFRTLYSGGLISIHGKDNTQIGMELQPMLEITAKLVQLERFAGFDKLLEGFRNPSQFNSTVFEAQVAAWCSKRRIFLGIEFSPEVEVRGGVKRPEFLWRTTLGDIYCECKQENSAVNSANRRILRLADVVDVAYATCGPWAENCRLDVVVQHPAKDGTSRIISGLVKRAGELQARGILGETLVEGVVAVKLAHCEEEAPAVGGSLQICRMQLQAGQQQVAVAKNALHTLTMSVMSHRLKQLTNLIRDARTQLPSEGFGAIFIDIGKSDLFSAKLKQLLSNSEYANTPWISTWERDQIGNVVCRTGQPLDGRLLE